MKTKTFIRLFVNAVMVAAFFVIVPTAMAATLTVCSSGCNYTSLATALSNADASDTVQIGDNDTIDEAGDDVDLGGTGVQILDANLTLSCTDGAEISNGPNPAENQFWVSIRANGVTVQNCSFVESSCDTVNEESGVGIENGSDNATITGNTFNKLSSPINASGTTDKGHDYTITNNTLNNVCGGAGIDVGGWGTITGNTITLTGDDTNAQGIYFNSSYDGAELTELETITISTNKIYSGDTSSFTSTRGIGIDSNATNGPSYYDFAIQDNTIRPEVPSTDYLGWGIEIFGQTEVYRLTITGNKIMVKSQGVAIGDPHASTTMAAIVINHNTIVQTGAMWGNAIGIDFEANGSTITVTDLDIKSNIFMNWVVGASLQNDTGNITSADIDYNFYGDNSGEEDTVGISAEVVTGDANSIGEIADEDSYNPALFLYTGDIAAGGYVSDGSFMTLKSCSLAIDSAHGSDDMGAETDNGARTTTITVDDSGGSHFMNLQTAVSAAADAGDSISLAAGTYPPAETDDKSISITGAGAATTTIDADDAATTALKISEASNETFSGFTVANVAANYVFTSTANPYTYSTKEYSDMELTGIPGVEDGTGTIFVHSNSGPFAADIGVVPMDGSPLVGVVNPGSPQTWNLALVQVTTADPVQYSTMYVANDVFSSSANLDTYLETQFGDDDFTVAFWEASIFTWNGGTEVYDYTIPTGPTYSGSPAINRAITTAGIVISGDSSSNTFSNIISDTNAVGIIFSDDAASNTVNDTVTFTDSGTHDLVSTSTEDNSVCADAENYTYTIAGAGTINFGSCGGGGGVPEFSTYMYLLTLMIGFGLIYKKHGYQVS
jgi:hypothetical protein